VRRGDVCQMEITLTNQIVILDEAHNIEDSSREAASFTVSQTQLLDAMRDLETIGQFTTFIGMVICLGADLHMAQLMPLPLTMSCSSKPRLVLPFWYRLTQVVPDKIQKSLKMIVCCMYVIIIPCRCMG